MQFVGERAREEVQYEVFEEELTRMHNRLEGQVAALDVEREFVDVHPAGADQHLVILDFDQTVALYC